MCVLEVIFEQKCLILWFLRISFFGTQKFVSLRIFHLLWHLSVIRIILHVQCWLQTHVSDCSRIFRNKCISFRPKFTHFNLVTNTAVAKKSVGSQTAITQSDVDDIICMLTANISNLSTIETVTNIRHQHRCSRLFRFDHFFAIMRFWL